MPDYTELNFVETCTTSNVGSSTVRECYSSATALNEILLVIVTFLVIVFLASKLLIGKN